MLDNYYVLGNATASIAIYLWAKYSGPVNILIYYSVMIIIIVSLYVLFYKETPILTIILSVIWWIILAYSANLTGNYIQDNEKKILSIL